MHIYRGTIVKATYKFEEATTSFFILAESFEKGFVFNLIQIDGYKGGMTAGHIAEDPNIVGHSAVSYNHLIQELSGLLLNLEEESLVLIPELKHAWLQELFNDIDEVSS